MHVDRIVLERARRQLGFLRLGVRRRSRYRRQQEKGSKRA